MMLPFEEELNTAIARGPQAFEQFIGSIPNCVNEFYCQQDGTQHTLLAELITRAPADNADTQEEKDKLAEMIAYVVRQKKESLDTTLHELVVQKKMLVSFASSQFRYRNR